jgi:predicted ester cyclase
MQRLWSAFPDAHFEIEHVAQDGDTALCVGTMSGTHEGELFGVPGSGNKIQLGAVPRDHRPRRSSNGPPPQTWSVGR